MSPLILYTTEDGQSQIPLRAENETVWLTQLEMAELFNASKQNISLHLKNLFKEGELHRDSGVKESLTTAADGKAYQTRLYNLDAILALGYRVRSPRGVQFCLSSIDELITAQTQKIDFLKIHKKGLMQQLFPTMDDA